MNKNKIHRLDLKTKVFYACGNLGIGFVGITHMLYLIYFFFPPKDAGLPYVIPQGSLLFGLTVLGLITALGRLVDAITDPLIATWSDNCEHPKGKRTVFMRRTSLFFAGAYVLVFFVPLPDSIYSINVGWIALMLVLAALFQTIYTIPHNALLVEIAEHPDDKVDLTTFSSMFWFAAFLCVSFSSFVWNFLQVQFDLTLATAMKYTFGLMCGIGFIFLMVPAIFIKENKYKKQNAKQAERIPFKKSLKLVLSNKNFCILLCWSALYNVATYFFECGLIYYITVLALKKAQMQGPLSIIIGAITLASYPFVNHFAKKIHKIKIVKLGFILFMLMFVCLSVMGLWGIPIYVMLALVIVFAPLPQSIFGMLVGAMSADCAAWGEATSKENVAGMYMAAGGFVAKIGATLATILFTSLLLFGKDVGDDLGIRFITIVGVILCALGLIFAQKYNEKEVMSYAKKKIRTK